jgi:biopolymer transport protein ExbD
MSIKARNKISVNFAMSGMTDIVFLLLIFFMIVSTLVVPGVMNVSLPESNNQTAANPEVNVSITKDLKYFVDGDEIPFGDVEMKLKDLLGNPEEPPTVRLNADEDIDMDQVFNFLDIAKRNKYRVIMGTRPLS